MDKVFVVGFNDPDELAPCTLPIEVKGPRTASGWNAVRTLFGNADVAEVRVWFKEDDGTDGARMREALYLDAEDFAEGLDWRPTR